MMDGVDVRVLEKALLPHQLSGSVWRSGDSEAPNPLMMGVKERFLQFELSLSERGKAAAALLLSSPSPLPNFQKKLLSIETCDS